MNSTDATDTNGRDRSGRFTAGNSFSRGRSSRSAELRKAFTEAVTDEDVAEIARSLVDLAKGGDIAAAKVVLDRCIGKVSITQAEPAEELSEGRNRVLEFVNMTSGNV